MYRSEMNKQQKLNFIEEWEKVIKALKRSQRDLSKIKLVVEVRA